MTSTSMTTKALAALVTAGALILSTQAMAAPTLRLTELGADDAFGGGDDTQVTVTDDGPDDIFGTNPGTLQFSGSVGSFDIQTTLGDTKPSLGNASLPIMKMSNTTIENDRSPARTLVVEFSETDFLGSGELSAVTTIGGDVANVEGGLRLDSFEAFIDPNNTLFGAPAGNRVANIGPLNTRMFSGMAFDETNVAGPNFAITQIATISGNGGNISFDASTTVSAPATLGLLGAGLVGLGLVARRRTATA